MKPAERSTTKPDISLVMPCYNEQEAIGYSIPELCAAFRDAGYRLELVAVDNGSSDRTGQLICELAAKDPFVVPHRVEKNQGYGFGILSGLPVCTADWVGSIPADGQVDSQDVVRLYQVLAATDGWVLGKVRRRFRMDGLWRKVVSVFYNLFICALWPGLGSVDINGIPKVIPRRAMEAMALESKGWLLDPEIMVKAHYLNLRVLELNVFARMRGGGVSHVRATTCWEFFSKLLAARLTNRWRKQLRPVPGDDLRPETGRL